MQESANDRRERPRQTGQRTLSVRIDHALVRGMVERCQNGGLSMTEAVTEALGRYLSAETVDR